MSASQNTLESAACNKKLAPHNVLTDSIGYSATNYYTHTCLLVAQGASQCTYCSAFSKPNKNFNTSIRPNPCSTRDICMSTQEFMVRFALHIQVDELRTAQYERSHRCRLLAIAAIVAALHVHITKQLRLIDCVQACARKSSSSTARSASGLQQASDDMFLCYSSIRIACMHTECSVQSTVRNLQLTAPHSTLCNSTDVKSVTHSGKRLSTAIGVSPIVTISAYSSVKTETRHRAQPVSAGQSRHTVSMITVSTYCTGPSGSSIDGMRTARSLLLLLLSLLLCLLLLLSVAPTGSQLNRPGYDLLQTQRAYQSTGTL
eukprot:12349-Heterococcus_DN1.PRE.3